MNTKALSLVTALLCGGLLAGATPALAHGDRYDRDDGWRERGRGWGHHKHHHHRYGPDTVVRERVIIRERPRYYEQRSYYYDAPAPVYRRDPAVVIGVQVPPLVIPLR